MTEQLEGPAPKATQDLVHAYGKALAMLVQILNARNVLSAREYAAHLSNLAAVVAEQEPEQGAMIMLWATILEASNEPTPGSGAMN